MFFVDEHLALTHKYILERFIKFDADPGWLICDNNYEEETYTYCEDFTHCPPTANACWHTFSAEAEEFKEDPEAKYLVCS